MTTAFRHAITPTISCEDLLKNMRQFLKQNNFQQVPQMSSEQFVQLDSGFVQYATKGKNKQPPPSAAAHALSHPSGISPHAAYNPAALPPSQMPSSPVPMATSPLHQNLQVDTEKYVMDSRINKLEEQIAMLRHTQHSPGPHPGHPGAFNYMQPNHYSPAGSMHSSPMPHMHHGSAMANAHGWQSSNFYGAPGY